MTDAEIRSLADALARLARPHLEKNEPLREALAMLGRWLTETATAAAAPPDQAEHEQPPTKAGTDNAAGRTSDIVVDAPQRREIASPAFGPPPVGVVPLRLGPSRVEVAVSGTATELDLARQAAQPRPDTPAATGHFDDRVADFELVEHRCRLKAASCRLLIEKRAAAAQSPEEAALIERMREMIAEAKFLPSCFLWVFWRERTPPADEHLRLIAAAYEVQADAVAAVRRMQALGSCDRETAEASLRLLAEANSALFAALGVSWLKDDRDQSEVHHWLRRETSVQGIYLGRHMSLEDQADPAAFEERARRVRDFVSGLSQRGEQTREFRDALSQIRYHAGQLLRSLGAEFDNNHRSKISIAIARLNALNVPPTDICIAEAIGSEAAELLRGSDAEGDHLLNRCLEAMRLRAVDSEEMDEVDERETAWSERVLEARKLLRGRRVVIIGGRPRQPAMSRLSRAFELADVDWVDLAEHGSSQPMVAPIQRADTALVVVILKLTGHLHAEEARARAAAAGPACVLLSGGYNPEKVAQGILEQASDRLRRNLVRS